jgi:Zn-finger nucleic acid-binding protein
MICPNCKQDMIVVEYHRIEVDYCLSCEGVWFDSGELDLLLGIAKLEKPQELMEQIMASPEAKSGHKERKCPICGRGMQEKAIDEPPINIDICRYGDGIWFDGGELNQLLTRLAQKNRQGEGARQEIINFLGDMFSDKSEDTEESTRRELK